uniref:Uncharacterized protein n=1 Tax=Oryza nivara TaxID=4536 RepID=A0A0E0GLC9_ORYNI
MTTATGRGQEGRRDPRSGRAQAQKPFLQRAAVEAAAVEAGGARQRRRRGGGSGGLNA